MNRWKEKGQRDVFYMFNFSDINHLTKALNFIEFFCRWIVVIVAGCLQFYGHLFLQKTNLQTFFRPIKSHLDIDHFYQNDNFFQSHIIIPDYCHHHHHHRGANKNHLLLMFILFPNHIISHKWEGKIPQGEISSVQLAF